MNSYLVAEKVRAMLRADAPAVVLGILLIAVGLAACALFRLRSRERDPAMLWFGLFAGLYGIRLLASAPSIRFITRPVADSFWLYLIGIITYIITVPAILFAYEIFPSWRPMLQWQIVLQSVFALSGIILDQAWHRPQSLAKINNVLVLGTFVALILVLFWQGQRTANLKVLQTGILVFAVTVFFNNMRGLGFFPFPLNPEPLGFALFVIALGYVAAVRSFEREERLSDLDKELEIAWRIQTSILPKEMPREPHIAIAARYLPMTAVAGDFYDFLILDSHRLGILVADVSGHGVPAALIASMVKVAIAAQLPHATDPARVLSGMNQILCGKLQGQFVTAAYLFLDICARTLRYSAAGHPAMLRSSLAEQTLEEVTENGLILGIRSAASYRSTERQFAPGDRFVLYTDGMVEATNAANEFFGVERLRAILSTSSALTADQCAESLVDSLARWAGYGASRMQEDDLTVVVVDVQ